MKDILIITSSLIIVVCTSLYLFSEILDVIITRSKKRRMNKIRIDYKNGDKQAELELIRQHDQLKREVQSAKYSLDAATENLEKFKIIYNSLNVEDVSDERISIKIPKNADSLSYTYPDMTANDREKRHIHFFGSEMDQLKKDVKFHED